MAPRNRFVGNLDLCQQLDTLCKKSLEFTAVIPDSDYDVDPASTKPSGKISNGILMGAMVTMGVTLLVLLFFLWYYFLCKNDWVKQPYTKMEQQLLQETDSKLVKFHGDLSYTSEDIIKGIETFDDTDIIGSGGFVSVYKLVMDVNSVFAMKKTLNNGVGSDCLFERELDILGSIKHRNLVNFRGYCDSPSTKLLIYDYLPLGILDELLHGETDSTLEWSAGLKIAIGAARDFGHAKLLEDDEINVTTIVAGTFGYLAPELLSGKWPTDQSFVIKGLNVVGWVNTLLRENRLEEVVDTCCDCTCKERMAVVLQIILRCIASNPQELPTMNQVVQILEAETMSPCPSDFYASKSE